MLPKNVLIAFFLAVCIRISDGAVTSHYCWSDRQVATELNNYSDGFVPILVIKGDYPEDRRNIFGKFMDEKYSHLIVVDNFTTQCPHTLDILNNRGHGKRVCPALFIMYNGHLVKDNRMAQFTSRSKLDKMHDAALKSCSDPNLLEATTILSELTARMLQDNSLGNNQVVNNQGYLPGILQTRPTVRNTAGYPQVYPQGYSQGYPQGHPVRNPVEYQPIRPVYATRQETPVERNLLGTMGNPGGRENNSGGSPQTYSQQVAWDYLERGQDQSRKRRRLGEGPSGPSE